MIAAGIDIGSRTVKAVVLRDGAVAGRAIALAGADAAGAARAVLAAALRDAAVTRAQLGALVATGAGRETAPDQDRAITPVCAAARGAVALLPAARTVVEIGAEEARAIRCDERGRVVDVAGNEECAAGAGAFVEAIARTLELRIEELGPLSMQSTRAIPLSAQCVVFAEREVVALIHANVLRCDVARAVHDAIAARAVSMLRKVGCSRPVALVGGVARNVGFVDSLKRGLQLDAVEVPEAPEHCAALGAALVAAEGA